MDGGGVEDDDSLAIRFGFFGVIFGGREDGPPGGKLLVEFGEVARISKNKKKSLALGTS
jgi:hypothetical protein